MELVYKHSKDELKERKEIPFATDAEGIYLIKVEARARSEKQLSKTDDEDLRIEIDKKRFPQLSNSERYLDSPASFSGGTLRGLKKQVLFILSLKKGKHIIYLIPDISAYLENIEIFKLPSDITEIELKVDDLAEDGDRRPWITFALVDIGCERLTVDLNLKKRFLDSDDVKTIVDGDIKRNTRNLLRKFWYFVTSILTGEKQKETFIVNLSPQLHYIEFWADRMPIFNTITFYNLTTLSPKSIEEEIREKAEEFKLDPDLMVRIARKESQLDQNAISPVGAKGIFQLMDITIKQIGNLGFEISNPYDVDQNITGAMTYFKWLSKMYLGDPEHLEKTLAAWNWGSNQFSKNEPLDYENLPNETRDFIRDILGK